MRRLRRFSGAAGVFALCVGGAGCAHYVPMPLEPTHTLESFQHRRLTDPAIIRHIQSALGEPVSDAPPEPPLAWGRAQLLLAALDLNPILAEARSQLAMAAAGETTARAIQNPTLSPTSEYDLSRAAESPWLWGVGTSFLLDSILGRKLRMNLAKVTVRGANADFRDAVWTVRRDVRAALLAVVVGERRIELLKLDVQQRSDIARLAHGRVEAGESAAVEGLQADLELTRARAALEEGLRATIDARAKLAGAIGLPAEALEHVAFDWDDLDRPPPVSPPVLAEARRQALLARPDLERSLADYDARELELQQQVGAQYLQTSLGPGYTWDHGVRKATFSASIALPLFNRNEGPIAEALAARDTAGRHAQSVQAAILNEIDSAAVGYDAALGALERARMQRVASERLAEAESRSLTAGESDRPMLLAAESTVNAERLAELDALDRAQQALGSLEDALRTPLSGPERVLK